MKNFKPLARLCSQAGRFESYLIENPEDMFSHDLARVIFAGYGNHSILAFSASGPLNTSMLYETMEFTTELFDTADAYKFRSFPCAYPRLLYSECRRFVSHHRSTAQFSLSHQWV